MKKTLKMLAILLVLAMAFGVLAACGNSQTPGTQQPSSQTPESPAVSNDPVETPPASEAPTAEALDRAELKIPNEYTKVKTFFGNWDFGDAEITAAMNDDETAFYITYFSFDEDQILIGTVQNGICLVSYDHTGFMAIVAQDLYEHALASEEPWHPLTGEGPVAPNAAPSAEPLDRAELGIPNEYTKVKTYFGTFGFGDAEITVAMTDDESAFYITYVSFDEDQILIGTVQNGICLVTYDRTGFMAMEAQGLYEMALSSEEPWHPLVGEAPAEALDRAELGIPNEYTKVKTFFGNWDFGDAEITAAMNDDETAFYITYFSFDEDQILIGTVQNGICLVSYDHTGFMAIVAQDLYEHALASEEPWHPLTGEGPVAPN